MKPYETPLGPRPLEPDDDDNAQPGPEGSGWRGWPPRVRINRLANGTYTFQIDATPDMEACSQALVNACRISQQLAERYPHTPD